MDTQRYTRFICLAPRSSHEPAAKLVPKLKPHFQTGAFQALQMANWQRPALSDLGVGHARPLLTALLHIVSVQSFLAPSPPDSPSSGLKEVISLTSLESLSFRAHSTLAVESREKPKVLPAERVIPSRHSFSLGGT